MKLLEMWKNTLYNHCIKKRERFSINKWEILAVKFLLQKSKQKISNIQSNWIVVIWTQQWCKTDGSVSRISSTSNSYCEIRENVNIWRLNYNYDDIIFSHYILAHDMSMALAWLARELHLTFARLVCDLHVNCT